MVRLKEEFPFAYVVTTSKKAELCAFCFKAANEGSDLQRCSQCRFCHYCSSECQKNAWSDHREECKALAQVSPKIPTDVARLMARIIWKLNRGISKNSEDDRSFFDLIHHSMDIKYDPIRSEHLVQIGFVLKEYMLVENLPEASKLIEIFGRIVCNAFTICNPDMQTTGIGLYLNLSKIDHSCNPNAVIVFDGPKAVLNSTDPNLKSFSDISQIRISYIELLQTTKDRQRMLKEQYYFECDCDRCENRPLDALMRSVFCPRCENAGIFDESEESAICQNCSNVIPNPNSALHAMQKCQWTLDQCEELAKNGENYQEILTISSNQLTEIERILHPLNIFRLKLLDEIFDACIWLQKWPQAVQFGRQTLPGFRRFYPKFHPALGAQILKIAKMENLLENLAEANCLFQEAESVISICYGESHPFYIQVKSLLDSCEEERRQMVIRSEFH